MSGHGGKRKGAGRPKGSGKRFKEPTVVKRIPKSKVAAVDRLIDGVPLLSPVPSPSDLFNVEEIRAATPEAPLRERPLLASRVPAGFPSPADDYIETHLDLNQYLIARPAATYHVRVSGDSMIGAGIMDGDILVVDRSLEATHNAIVVAIVDGEPTVKRLHRQYSDIRLCPENPEYPTIWITSDRSLQIWGVVTGVVRKF